VVSTTAEQTPEDGTPYAIPIIYNATYIGSGVNSPNADNDLTLIFRDNAGGKYYNSIFTDFAGRAITIEDVSSGEDSRARLETADLVLQNNIWFGFGAGINLSDFAGQDFVQSYLTDPANDNRVVDPQLQGISRTNDGGLDPRPKSGSPAFSGARNVPAGDDFFIQTGYVGAFGRVNWASGWTFLSQSGILSPTPTLVVEERSLTGAPPNGFSLNQNYPNPFNPTTVITYSIATTGAVTLTVYDLLGQEVATLVDGVRPAGTYAVTWNASGLASGTYIYRLEAGSTVLSKKMILSK
jgi:hypothetical protein